jgi:hypothetical protein
MFARCGIWFRFQNKKGEAGLQDNPYTGTGNSRKSSLLSTRLAGIDSGRDTTIGALVDLLGSQAFGVTMFIFAAANLVPNPPGTSPVLGAPLVFLSSQLVLGRRVFWLPQWIRGKPLSHKFVSSFVQRIGPFVERLERFLQPRYSALADTSLATRTIGLVSLPLSLILLLPLPFLHMIPGAAMTCLAAGLAERDGLFVAAGLALALASLLGLVAIAMLGHTAIATS